MDGFGIGFGFTVSLVLISAIREVLGSGTVLGYKIFSGAEFSECAKLGAYQPMSVMIMAPGAFLVLGLLLGLFNFINRKKIESEQDELKEFSADIMKKEEEKIQKQKEKKKKKKEKEG